MTLPMLSQYFHRLSAVSFWPSVWTVADFGQDASYHIMRHCKGAIIIVDHTVFD